MYIVLNIRTQSSRVSFFQVNRESKTGGVPGGVATGLVSSTQHNIPIIIRRCVEEVERRGLDIIGKSSRPTALECMLWFLT